MILAANIFSGESLILCILQKVQNRARIFSRSVSRKAACRLVYMIAGAVGRVKGGLGEAVHFLPLTRPAGAATAQSCHRNRPQAVSG